MLTTATSSSDIEVSMSGCVGSYEGTDASTEDLSFVNGADIGLISDVKQINFNLAVSHAIVIVGSVPHGILLAAVNDRFDGRLRTRPFDHSGLPTDVMAGDLAWDNDPALPVHSDGVNWFHLGVARLSKPERDSMTWESGDLCYLTNLEKMSICIGAGSPGTWKDWDLSNE
jgi:hypothetical protein